MVLILVTATTTSGAFAQKNKRVLKPVPALTRVESSRNDWTVSLEYTITDSLNHFSVDGFPVRELRANVPLLPDTGISTARPQRLTGAIVLKNGRRFDDREIINNLPCLTSVASWRVRDFVLSEARLDAQISVSSYETRINEELAVARQWPNAPWSAQLATCLEPQPFIESNETGIKRLVQMWTRGKPKKAKPYVLAKYLASKVIASVRLSESRYSLTHPFALDERLKKRGNISMVLPLVHGAAWAAKNKTTNRYDLACLLTAVYRAAGIPARLVIGVDVVEATTTDTLPLHAWVEFFLPYPHKPDVPVTNDDGEWIPVDIYRQVLFSSQPPDINQRWQFFGHNEESDDLAPLSFHWLTPGGPVESAAPTETWIVRWSSIPQWKLAANFRISVTSTANDGSDR